MTTPDGGWELRCGSPRYPDCLEASPRPPEILYGFGDTTLLTPGLGIVGARRATPYGLSLAREFAAWAAAEGVTVVSGAALGCDRAAQAAAIEAGGRTVAVLGCGADLDYPSSSRELLETLRREHAVVSEIPWKERATVHTFPARNRIIAALSRAVLIVEAALGSGTFSTADHALQAGREVLVVPGSVYSDTSRGCNRLLFQGATPIADVYDLAHALAACGLCASPRRDGQAANADLSRLDAVSQRIARALLADPMHPDDAARALELSVVTLMRALGYLESEFVVARYPDGRYGPCSRC